MIFYYDSEKNVYNTQWEAVTSGKRCWLYYYNDVFNSIDWKKEPTESLDNLYKFRAQEIRDSYDYVILCYSGGHDSTNILETFYYNNIHIDEIVLIGTFSQDSYSGSDENRNAEIHLNCFPTLKKMNLPKTKITIADYSEYFSDPKKFTLIKNYGNEWIKHIGTMKSVGHLFWYDFKQFIGEKNDKKTCYIMGVEKLNYSRGSFMINDYNLYTYGGIYKNENFERVNFYTSPNKTCLDIMRKQAHIIKKANSLNIQGLRKIDCFDKDWETAYERVIYNLKNPISYESPKSKFSTFSTRDQFILKNKQTEIYKYYEHGKEILNRYVPDNSKIIFFTKSYQIE